MHVVWVFLGPWGPNKRSNACNDELGYQDDNDGDVGSSFKVRPFGGCFGGILHYFSFMTCENGDSEDIFCVSQGWSSQEHVVSAERNSFVVLVHDAFELIDCVVWRLRVDCTVKRWVFLDRLLVLIFIMINKLLVNWLHFQICFSVKRLGFNVTDTFRVRWVGKEDITWQHLVWLYPEGVSYSNFLPLYFLEFAISKHFGYLVIFFGILLMSL